MYLWVKELKEKNIEGEDECIEINSENEVWDYEPITMNNENFCYKMEIF